MSLELSAVVDAAQDIFPSGVSVDHKEPSAVQNAHTGLTQEFEELSLSGDRVSQALAEDELLDGLENLVTNGELVRDELFRPVGSEKPNMIQGKELMKAPEDWRTSIGEKNLQKNSHYPPKTIVRQIEMVKGTLMEEDFAEVLLDDEWVKVEVLTREGLAEGNCLVTRIDGSYSPFEVKIQDLTSFGSHDPESEWQIRKREEFEKLEKLLNEKECTIEKMEEDGNCLFRAVARQIYGDQKRYKKIRKETVEHVVAHRNYFARFETDIDGRILEQLRNGSWGGNLEIMAASERYNVGVVVW